MGNLIDYGTGTVATAPSPATSGTSLILQAGEGARMPATPFTCTAHPDGSYPTLDNAEKLLVTNVSSDTLTITRAQGSTTAKSIAVSWRISNALFAADVGDAATNLTSSVDSEVALFSGTGGKTLKRASASGIAHLASGVLTASNVVESEITTADNTTNDVVSTKHGFAPKSPADATKFLNGAATPAYAQPKDSDLSTTDITTNNATTSKHGFLPKLNNTASNFLDMTGSQRALLWSDLPNGAVVQKVGTFPNLSSTGTTVIPNDNTIPQNTEGDQYMTQAITPKATTNTLWIEAIIYGACSNANDHIAALFQDSTANALAAGGLYNATTNGGACLKIFYSMAAGTTSSTTFKIRAGPGGAATYTFNGAAGAQRYAVPQSSLVITEVKA